MPYDKRELATRRRLKQLLDEWFRLKSDLQRYIGTLTRTVSRKGLRSLPRGMPVLSALYQIAERLFQIPDDINALLLNYGVLLKPLEWPQLYGEFEGYSRQTRNSIGFASRSLSFNAGTRLKKPEEFVSTLRIALENLDKASAAASTIQKLYNKRLLPMPLDEFKKKTIQ